MIDLHIHTTCSDGTYTVKEILKEAETKKLEIISITDHDSVKAYYEIIENKFIREIFKGKIIIGTEIKCYLEDMELPIEILAYGIELKKIEEYFSKNNVSVIQQKYLEHLKKVGKKIGLIFRDVQIEDNKNDYASNIFQREILKYPKNEEILKRNNISLEPYFYRSQQCNKNSIFYINEKDDFIRADQIIKVIHNAGGLAFLAHPFIYPTKETERLVKTIIDYGVDGIECYHSSFTPEQMIQMVDICKKSNLYISGGSDFHGGNKPNIKMGDGRDNLSISQELIKPWIDKIQTI